jgi:hypothetical protein
MISAPGVYSLSKADYLADPCPAPSLSSHVANVLLRQSPAHARLKHPRLNPAAKSERKREFDLGSAAHAILLEGARGLRQIGAENYRTKAAQQARDEAYEVGLTPILPRELERAYAMADAARQQIARHEEIAGILDAGVAEQVWAWQDGDIWLRGRPDWLPSAGNIIVDYKTTGGSAHPDEWQRACFDLGYDLQAATYLRGARALGLSFRHFVFLVQETDPPHALSVVSLSPFALERGELRYEEAVRLWAWCLKHNRWGGYPRRTAYIDPPGYLTARDDMRVMREQLAAEDGQDVRELMIEWQAPQAPQEEAANV